MANLYKNSMFDLTTTNSTVVYTCPTDRTALIKTIQVTNIHSGANEIEDRKSTRLNSSHGYISYAVFCLKKKKVKLTSIH